MKKCLPIFLILISNILFADNIDSLLNVAKKNTSDKNYVNTLCEIAGYYEDKGEYEKSISFALNAGKLSDSLRYKGGKQRAFNIIGNCYLDRGDVKKALEYCLATLKIREELGLKNGIAYSYLNLGNIYFRTGDNKMALQTYSQSLKILYEVKDTLRVAVCLSNMGSIYSEMHLVKEAEEFYLKALSIRKRMNDADGLAETMSNLSVTFMDAKEYSKALDWAFQTIALYGEEGSKLGKAISYSNIGDIYEHMSDYSNAIKYQEMSMRLAMEMKSQFMLQTCYQLLAVVYSKKNDFKNALFYTEKFTQTRDSIMNSENGKQISEMQTRFETGKKQKEIELLQKDNSIRELQIAQQNAKINGQRIIIFSVIGGLVILVFVISLIWSGYRRKKKINSSLEILNSEINLQKNLIEEKNELITDSIDYARNIQSSIFPLEEKIKSYFPEFFTLYLPKEIVSGDFYWLKEKSNNSCLFATAKCAENGVPGAFMSVTAFNMLENIDLEKNKFDPANVLDELNLNYREKFKNEIKSNAEKNKMDISMIAYDFKKMELKFAGANTQIIIVPENKKVKIVNTKNNSIGIDKEKYTCETISAKKDDMIYLFTEGFMNQIPAAGDLQQLLISMADNNCTQQKEILQKTLSGWKGSREQTDDVLVTGIRI